jgi:hypothetical protein
MLTYDLPFLKISSALNNWDAKIGVFGLCSKIAVNISKEYLHQVAVVLCAERKNRCFATNFVN